MSAARLIHGSTDGGAESELVEYAKNPTTPRSKSEDNKAIVDRWFTEFWGKSWNPKIVDELGAPDILLQYLLQAPHRGKLKGRRLGSPEEIERIPSPDPYTCRTSQEPSR